MLCPRLYRQRLTVEFTTEKDLYTPEIIEMLLENFLYDLCGTLGMTILIDPIIRTVEDGTSAYVMFTESGCHIHSWYEHKFISVDIYSCKPFMVSVVLDLIDYYFEPIDLEVV